MDRYRHNALGETVLLGIGRELTIPGPTDGQEVPKFEVILDAKEGHNVAATIAGDNGTFVQFFHDGTIAVGNDGRDIDEVRNLRREATRDRKRNGIGGSVTVTFTGNYRPRNLREADHYIEIPERTSPPSFRLYSDEFEIR
jgi:hypothetical protein